MTNLVEFPGLGLSFEVPRVAFTLFGMPVYWYGVCIGVGLLLALIFAFRQANRFGLDSERMVDVIIIGFVLSIVCGRLYYVLFSGYSYNSFFDVIDLRSGGIAIYGAIIGAFAGAVIGCKWRKVPMLPLLDVAGMSFLIGQAIGRWGNFFNQEAFGGNTTMPWGMISPETTAYLQNHQAELVTKGIYVDPALPVHPTFLYESLWCLLGLLLLFLYRKHRKFNGEILLFYAIWYGFGRFFIEGLRTDPLMVGPLRVSQIVAALSVVAGVVIWAIARRKTAGKPLVVPEIPPREAVVNVQTEDGVQSVTISWPANGKAPTRAQRTELAKQALAAEKATAADAKPVQATAQKQAATAQVRPKRKRRKDLPAAAPHEKHLYGPPRKHKMNLHRRIYLRSKIAKQQGEK